MENHIHTVIGASGAMGKAVIEELQNNNKKIRAVSRSESFGGMENIPADLTKPDGAERAIRGSNYVYLCLGLPYYAKVWLSQWPLIMQNVIRACERNKANLIFLDNAYMYGPAPLNVPFDENHKQQPTTKKGMARKQTADLLMHAIQQGKVNAVIGRSADFYGEQAVNGAFYPVFLENMLKGKAPQFMGKLHTKHTFSNVSDNARALVTLALDQNTYGQVWHLPVGDPVSISYVADIMNEILGTNYKVRYTPPFIRKMIAQLSPIVKEVSEMLYQYETDYIMSWEKFQHHFPDFKVTPYEKGIEGMIRSFQQEKTVA